MGTSKPSHTKIQVQVDFFPGCKVTQPGHLERLSAEGVGAFRWVHGWGVNLKFRIIRMGAKEPPPPGFHQQMFVGPLKTRLPEPPQRFSGRFQTHTGSNLWIHGVYSTWSGYGLGWSHFFPTNMIWSSWFDETPTVMVFEDKVTNDFTLPTPYEGIVKKHSDG